MKDSSKTNIDVSFKKNLYLNSKNMLQNICCLKRVSNLLSFVTFNIILSEILPGNFTEIQQASQEVRIFSSFSSFEFFCQLFGFFY